MKIFCRSITAYTKGLGILLGLILLGAPSQAPSQQAESPFVMAGAMPYGRQMHGAVVAGDNLYVIGGSVRGIGGHGGQVGGGYFDAADPCLYQQQHGLAE